MHFKKIKNDKIFYRKIDLIWYLLIFIFIIFIDQLTKFIAKSNYCNNYSIFFFKFSPILNHGIAFGLFSNSSIFNQYFLGLVSLISLSFIFYLFFKKYKNDKPAFLETIILSGSISNISDRFIHGGIVDFLTLNIIDSYIFPIGNIADILILISIFLLIFKFYSQNENFKNEFI